MKKPNSNVVKLRIPNQVWILMAQRLKHENIYVLKKTLPELLRLFLMEVAFKEELKQMKESGRLNTLEECGELLNKLGWNIKKCSGNKEPKLSDEHEKASLEDSIESFNFRKGPNE